MSDSTLSVPVEERLFSLVLALVATEGGLTKEGILSTVQGYRQRYRPGHDNASLERQFERDKDDIRELGIPLETVVHDHDDGNTQNARYRIPKGEYDLPAGIEFTAEEVTLLGLAATVWREGSLSEGSQRALTKIKSQGVQELDPVIGVAPRIRTRESAFEPIRNALEKHMVVSFPYLKPGETSAQRRTVAPLALVQHSGRWHVYAIDEDTGERRTFLLSRMVASPRSTGRTFTPPDEESFSDTALRSLENVWESNTASVRVRPDSYAWYQLSRRSGAGFERPGVIRLHYTDVSIMADELASFGPEAQVLAPQVLRQAVIERLSALSDVHRASTTHTEEPNGVS